MVDEQSGFVGRKWKRELSAGGIVYKKQDSQIFILLIEPRGPKFGPGMGFYSYPKGRIGDEDPNDTPETAALREVKEEGGVVASIVSKLGSVKYTFQWEDQNIFKIVTYYLMRYESGDPQDHDNEVAESSWFPIEEVESKLKYKHDKEIFQKAKSSLSNI
jgi:predicted NUDIX family NTP pyrophosphohydrolase